MLCLALGAGLAAAALFTAPAASLAQEVNLTPRVHLILYDQWSFVEHPYRQITDDAEYGSARAQISSVINIGPKVTDGESDSLTRAVHSLPPFAVEGVTAVDFPFPRGLSVGFNYHSFAQDESGAVPQAGKDPTPIRTDTYLYTGSIRLFAFDPTEPGLNYYLGATVGMLEGNMLAQPEGRSDEVVHYAQSPVGGMHYGLETKGNNWGFRYELTVLRAREVKLESNPYPTTDTEIDFSGSVMRLALFYEFN